jgi:pterin-4a-carbinolamine dehydratase
VTHSEGGITDKDVAMARDIDAIIGSSSFPKSAGHSEPG